MNSLVGMNVFCCWPNGENKNVVVTGIDGDHAVVIWNENHSPMGELGCVVGCDARVPLEWLSVPYCLLAATQGRERKLREALIRLEAAADAYCADQRTATNKHVGLVQPITVEQGEELNCALVEAATALAATKED